MFDATQSKVTMSKMKRLRLSIWKIWMN